ncbi:MAG: carboxypeptidase regulatory-like domain-containing protein [Candidatus Stygibacter frigidus]|nr:carboxypeptidase regulatory-like domain-containing protein [Candidatus Stygibacter frigidus]
MKNIFICFIILIFMYPLSAVHNFTINGQESLTVAVSDSLYLEFDFENEGNSADFDLSIEIIGQQIPLFSGNYMLFQDGGLLDNTGLDGSFAGGFNNFIQLPEGTTLVVTLTDDEVSDAVQIQFEQLDTDFSISGTVTQEGGWIDLPVIGGVVFTIYNGSAEYLIDLFENLSLEALLEFISSDHYLLSDLTGFLGTYQIFVPEDIPDVPCAVGVYSALDLNGEFIAPEIQEVTVNGNVSGIDFYYSNPDGDFSGLVLNTDGEPVANAAFVMENPNSAIPWFFTTDETGAFLFALANGTYSYTVAALGYETYSDEVTINDNNVYQEIVLQGGGGQPGGVFYGFVLNEQSEPMVNAEIVLMPVSGGDPQYVYTMADGSFSIELMNGIYNYMVSHAWYVGQTGEFEIADSDVYLEIVMQPVDANDEDVLSLRGLRAYPNPFNPQINFSFQLIEPSQVALQIYNIRGELVKTVINHNLAAGDYNISWTGISADNTPLSSGIYYYRIQSNDIESKGKILLLK